MAKYKIGNMVSEVETTQLVFGLDDTICTINQGLRAFLGIVDRHGRPDGMGSVLYHQGELGVGIYRNQKNDFVADDYEVRFGYNCQEGEKEEKICNINGFYKDVRFWLSTANNTTYLIAKDSDGCPVYLKIGVHGEIEQLTFDDEGHVDSRGEVSKGADVLQDDIYLEGNVVPRYDDYENRDISSDNEEGSLCLNNEAGTVISELRPGEGVSVNFFLEDNDDDEDPNVRAAITDYDKEIVLLVRNKMVSFTHYTTLSFYFRNGGKKGEYTFYAVYDQVEDDNIRVGTKIEFDKNGCIKGIYTLQAE